MFWRENGVLRVGERFFGVRGWISSWFARIIFKMEIRGEGNMNIL